MTRVAVDAYIVKVTGKRKLDNPEGMGALLDALHDESATAPTHWGKLAVLAAIDECSGYQTHPRRYAAHRY